MVGMPFPVSDYISNGFFAFIFGYKIVWLAVNACKISVQEHLLTTEGSIIYGIIATALVLAWRYWEDKKQRLAQPQKQEVILDASVNMGTITAIALISGFLGAKLFHILEDPQQFKIEILIDTFFSRGGWTFYGGLICGGAGVLYYCYRKKYNLLHVLDSGGPMMMLAYGIGRFGCHFSGDGDWGLPNKNPKPFPMPDWLWSYTYPNNVLGDQSFPPSGMVQIPGQTGEFSYELALPVWPTPLYEALAALALFAVLWLILRKKISKPGNLFAWYLIFAGIERFLIEIIREHGESLYTVGSVVFSQAQFISLILIFLGSSWLLYTSFFKKAQQES